MHDEGAVSRGRVQKPEKTVLCSKHGDIDPDSQSYLCFLTATVMPESDMQ